ncbi:MAG TPA: response regulator [Nitrospirota bacterium]
MMKILLVEDDDIVRNFLTDMLQAMDHTVDGSTSAEEALRKLPGDYQLIISDILLKKMDGLVFLERVNEMHRRVPVVMITGFGGPEVEEICRNRGAAGFLNKPFSAFQLKSVVDEMEKISR